jgi:spore coat protein U-like protein
MKTFTKYLNKYLGKYSGRHHWLSFILACALWFCIPAAFAVTCSISSTGLSTTHTPNAATANVTQSSLTFTCSRGTLELVNYTDYSIAVNDGIHASGAQNQAQTGANVIQYETYQGSTCSSTAWSSASPITGRLTMTNANTNYSVTINYWGCIPINQQVPVGSYLDTVTMTATFTDPIVVLTTTKTVSNTFPVTITNPAVCLVTSISNVAFGSYVAFRNTALAATPANVVLNCTPQLSYTLSLDANTGVVAGLNYSLSLSAASSSGTGPGQTQTISGSMPASQAGTCTTGSCTASDPRVLTITY